MEILWSKEHYVKYYFWPVFRCGAFSHRSGPKIPRYVPFLLWAKGTLKCMHACKERPSYHLVKRSRTFPFLTKATAATTTAALTKD